MKKIGNVAELMKTLKLLVEEDSIPANYTGRIEWYLEIIDTKANMICYFKNSLYHNTEGPSIITPHNAKIYFLEDINYSEEEWFEKLSPEQKIKALWNLENWE